MADGAVMRLVAGIVTIPDQRQTAFHLKIILLNDNLAGNGVHRFGIENGALDKARWEFSKQLFGQF
ncbi:hypothetical protein D3C86_2250950 [compost metagenome]